MNTQNATAQNTNTTFAVGMWISHPELGLGQIVSVTPAFVDVKEWSKKPGAKINGFRIGSYTHYAVSIVDAHETVAAQRAAQETDEVFQEEYESAKCAEEKKNVVKKFVRYNTKKGNCGVAVSGLYEQGFSVANINAAIRELVGANEIELREDTQNALRTKSFAVHLPDGKCAL